MAHASGFYSLGFEAAIPLHRDDGGARINRTLIGEARACGARARTAGSFALTAAAIQGEPCATGAGAGRSRSGGSGYAKIDLVDEGIAKARVRA